jgi:hypothetical protein
VDFPDQPGASDETFIMIEPPHTLGGEAADRPEAIRRLIGKYDPAARDARNRALGRAGEEFVLGFGPGSASPISANGLSRPTSRPARLFACWMNGHRPFQACLSIILDVSM